MANPSSAAHKDAEIADLLARADAARENDPQGSYGYFRLAEKVIRASGRLALLHEALGGQGRALRRSKRFEEAIQHYQAAEQAASNAVNLTAQALWALRRASAQRSLGQLEDARAAVAEAELLLRPPAREGSLAQILGRIDFSDHAAVAALAELEGQIGLNLKVAQDDEGAEDHYRSALYFAEMAGDGAAVNTWGINVGNACARRRRYGEALTAYELALAAARQLGAAGGVMNAADGIAACLAQAFRHEEGGDRMLAIAAGADDPRLQLPLLYKALQLYDGGLCAAAAIAAAQRIEQLGEKQPLRPEFLAEVRGLRQKMERLAAMAGTRQDGPPALDVFIVEWMARAQEQGEPELALDAAGLVCDVRLALALAGDDAWKRMVGGDMLAQAGLDQRAVADTLLMLVDKDRSDDALELLQRLKAPTFCVPTLLRQDGPDVAPEVKAYLAAARALRDEVAVLAGPAQPDFMRAINTVRRAAERLREAGEAVRDVDPLLLARLGGTVRRQDLVDALPYGGGVGIVDFVVGQEATVGIVLGRGSDGVVATSFVAPTFNATHVQQLLDLYAKGNLAKQLGGAQMDALLEISQILHDHFFCKFAQAVGARGINQLVLVPDVFTRNLPLHLARACGKEFDIPGVDTADAGFLCEVMPVEYAPCLQAVAASQVYLRPRVVARVAAFADPQGDLPAARAAMELLRQDAGKPEAVTLAVGSAATHSAVRDALQQADVLLFGTHGNFAPGNLQQTQLVLNGEPWTMADMLRMPQLHKQPLLVLMACEVGAVAATPDDRNAWGVPGALVAAGASAVLANLWPVEDITAGWLQQRFMHHLGHRGYRPAAALFRAVRDLRRTGRDEALAYCRRHLAWLEQNGAPAQAMLGAETLVEWIEDSELERPFAHPFFWGATAIFGSGWHLPAGAVVGSVTLPLENELRLREADELLAQGHARQAAELAAQVAAVADGVPRGRAYTAQAAGLLRSADPGTERRVRQQATRLLAHAARIAASEDDEPLRQRVEWVRSQLEDDHVDA